MSAALPSPSDRFRVWLLGAWCDAQQPPRAMPESSVAYTIRSNVRAGELQKIKQMFKDGVDIEAVMEPSDTLRKWTPLHIAAWGTAKPQYDRDIIEQLLLAANKAGKDAPIRGAKCGIDGETPLDLVRGSHDPPSQMPSRQSLSVYLACTAGEAAVGEARCESSQGGGGRQRLPRRQAASTGGTCCPWLWVGSGPAQRVLPFGL